LRAARHIANRLIWALFFLLFATASYTQDVLTSSQFYYPQNTSRIGFSQEFNSYIWNYNLTTRQIRHKKWTAFLGERYRSSMLRVSSVDDRWKDDQQLTFNLQYQLQPFLALQSVFSSTVFLDQQSGFNNDIKTNSNLVGVLFEPSHKFNSRLLVGPKLDSRFNQHDKGTSFTFQANATDVKWEEYDNSINFYVAQDKFKTRKNSDFNVGYQMQRRFSAGTSDSLYVFTTNRRRDNYASITGDVESYLENIKGLNNKLRYTLSKRAYFDLTSSLQFKNVQVQNNVNDKVSRRRKRNDQRVSNDLSHIIKTDRLFSRLVLSYWTQEQKYDLDVNQASVPFSSRTAFVTPNNKSNRLALQSKVGLRINKSDSIHTFLSMSRFQYDTPDTNNFDDRDELRINSRISVSHFFNPHLKLVVHTSVNLYHMVYIFGERSADNNWNRIFRLRPVVDYRPSSRFRLKQAFEVLANYVDYDFGGLNVATRSFVFRKFAIDDSLQYSPTDRLTFLFDYRLQLEENGQLSWSEWTERILATRRNRWLHGYLKYSFKETISISPGYTFYLREEWRHKLSQGGVEFKEKIGPFKSHGPVLRFIYSPHYKMRLELDATRYAVEPPNQTKYYNNDLSINLYWIF
jgi:hypothetical protein